MNASVTKAVEDLSLIRGVQVLVCPPNVITPDFIRFPRSGERCPVSGMPRGTLRDCIAASGGKVTVRVVRRNGATRGVLLIDRQSLVDYLHSLPVADLSASDEGDEDAP